MDTEPSTSTVKIKVDEHYPTEVEDDYPFDLKKIENIRTNVKFDQCYEIAKHIGDGKFGKVYQVKEKSTGIEFAAKFIKIRKEVDRTEVEREVSILTQLRHPRIAQIYDAFYTTTNDVVLIMEVVRGGELFDRVADESYVLTEQAVAMIICQLCEAILYIHEQHILHLDIKPENIMCVSQTGNRIKLIDFGLARHYDGTQELKYMAGTPEFAAPEVIKFEKLDFHTDMWSVGVITYILLSGYSPFLGDNLGETYCNVERGIWEFTEEFDTVSEEAKHFISNLLIFDQSKRMLPKQCLEHGWIATHRAKLRNDVVLEHPAEGAPIDNKQMMRYNAKRKFRRMIIYVKFLIEMNRLRSSLRNRMSQNGQKYFEPMLKMAEEKERRLTLVTPAMQTQPESVVHKIVTDVLASKPEISENRMKKKLPDDSFVAEKREKIASTVQEKHHIAAVVDSMVKQVDEHPAKRKKTTVKKAEETKSSTEPVKKIVKKTSVKTSIKDTDADNSNTHSVKNVSEAVKAPLKTVETPTEVLKTARKSISVADSGKGSSLISISDELAVHPSPVSNSSTASTTEGTSVVKKKSLKPRKCELDATSSTSSTTTSTLASTTALSAAIETSNSTNTPVKKSIMKKVKTIDESTEKPASKDKVKVVKKKSIKTGEVGDVTNHKLQAKLTKESSLSTSSNHSLELPSKSMSASAEHINKTEKPQTALSTKSTSLSTLNSGALVRRSSNTLSDEKKVVKPKSSKHVNASGDVDSVVPSKKIKETDKSIEEKPKKPTTKKPEKDLMALVSAPPEKTTLGVSSVPKLSLVPDRMSIPAEKKTVKTERSESTKENQEEEKKPVRKTTLKKKQRSDDSVISSASIELKPAERKLVRQKTAPAMESSSSQERTTDKLSLVQQRLRRLNTLDVPMTMEIAGIPKIKVDTPPAVSEPIKRSSRTLELTPEKKTTTTTATTTSVKRQTSSVEKKVNHTKDGKSVEQTEKSNTTQDDLKISKVTTKKEELPDTKNAQTSMKKNVLKKKTSNTLKEKNRREEEKSEKNTSVVKTSATIKSSVSDSLSNQQLTKANGLSNSSSTTVSQERAQKVVGRSEVEVTPKKTTTKKLEFELSKKNDTSLEAKIDDKKMKIQKSQTGKVLVKPEVNAASSSLDVRRCVEAASVSASAPSSRRTSAADHKKNHVRFSEVVEEKQLSPILSRGCGLMKLKSESCIPSKISGSASSKTKVTMDDGVVRKKKSFFSAEFKETDFKDEFDFDSLKEKLVRRLSNVDAPEITRTEIRIPQTSSVKDRLRQFQKKMGIDD